jgi:hypothetical protein
MDVRVINEMVQQQSAFVDNLSAEVGKVIVGQKPMVDRILIGLLTGGHVLLEGVPGLAKTLTVKTLADALSMKFSRVQFTPDLAARRHRGHRHLQPEPSEFIAKKGPIFANLVLADEINRAPAKVQSALLEAMQERQVTIGDTTHILPDPVPGHGHAEPHRAGRHLRPARGAARPLHVDGQGRLPEQGRRAHHHGSHDHGPCREGQSGGHARADRPRAFGHQPDLHRREDPRLHHQLGAGHARSEGLRHGRHGRLTSSTAPARAHRSI